MNIQNWFLLANIFICLVVSALSFAILVHKKSTANIVNASLFIVPTTTLSIYCGSIWSTSDLISDISFIQFISPVAFGAVFVIVPLFKQLNLLYRIIITVLLSGIAVFGLNLPVNIIPDIHSSINQIIAVFIWTAVTLGFRILNKYDGFAISENLSVCTGILALYFIGAAPFVLGFYAAGLAATSLSFMLYNKYPAHIKMSDSTADLIGFSLGGLMILSSIEKIFSPVLIFSMMFFAELLFALMQKLTFLPQYNDIANNTSCAKAINSGMPHTLANNHFLRINAFLIIFGCFQAHSSTPYSLIMITTIIIAWQMYRLINWQQDSSSIKQTNKDVMQSIKKGISTINEKINSTNEKN